MNFSENGPELKLNILEALLELEKPEVHDSIGISSGSPSVCINALFREPNKPLLYFLINSAKKNLELLDYYIRRFEYVLNDPINFEERSTLLPAYIILILEIRCTKSLIAYLKAKTDEACQKDPTIWPLYVYVLLDYYSGLLVTDE